MKGQTQSQKYQMPEGQGKSHPADRTKENHAPVLALDVSADVQIGPR